MGDFASRGCDTDERHTADGSDAEHERENR